MKKAAHTRALDCVATVGHLAPLADLTHATQFQSFDCCAQGLGSDVIVIGRVLLRNEVAILAGGRSS